MPRNVPSRGGARRGSQGQAYSNRTDLNQNRQPIQVASGQPYGARQEQVAAQQAIPLPGPPPVQAPPPLAPGADIKPFGRPTEYPNEPLTAGMAMGAGPGPEALAARVGLSHGDELVAQLRGLYDAFPSDDIERLLNYAEQRAGR